MSYLLGYGILPMPYALAEGGWISLGALFVIGGICSYTAILLQQCMESNELVKTYPDIGQLAFGIKGRNLMDQVMNAIGLLIIEGDNIDLLFPGIEFHIFGKIIKGKQCFIILSALVVLPTTWPKDLRVLSYLSFTSFLVFLLLLVLIIWIGAFQGVGFHGGGVVVNFGRLPTSLSIFIFSFGGHTIIPTVYASMKDTKKFSKVLIIGFTVSTLQYAVMAVTGYLMFGKETNSIVTLNLPQRLVTSKITIWTVIAIPLVKYALVLMPVVNSIEAKFQVTGRLAKILFRTFLVISTVVIASGIPFFTTFISLVGSLLSSMASILLPCLCYLKIFKSTLKWGHKMFTIIFILGVGVLIAILGTYVSIKQIIQDN
ncbi:hypothetical protein KSP40_PGU000757 [Platanthera guangdongensis]|uniref:Amino acid transporter transmembrane domain-containing protein n=1 Tax=Platanthera guangdongensis TaxID=2320717 RepID=A0ABR2MT90_9ASPA